MTIENIERWKALSDNEDWNERADLVKNWLAEAESVLDVGCGVQYVEKLLAPNSKYLGIDIVERSSYTRVMNLNDEMIPADLLSTYHLSVFLGVLEYLNAPLLHLAEACKHSRRIVFSYTPVDYVSAIEVRRCNDWVSDLSTKEINEFILLQDVDIEYCCRFDSQVIYVLSNRKLSKEVPKVIPNILTKKKVILSGFFGRGNAGDEAIVQRLYEYFRFDLGLEVAISVDFDGAYDGFWNWYPYNKAEIVHSNNLSRVTDKDIIGLHIGGGGLPYGFNASQIKVCTLLNKKLVYSGVDDVSFSLKSIQGFDIQRLDNQIAQIDCTYVRTQFCYDNSVNRGLKTVKLGADWAIDLKMDEISRSESFSGIYLTIRELPNELLDAALLQSYGRLFDKLKSLGVEVRLLPFCSEDERYLERICFFWDLVIEREWWNPRRLKGKIAKAQGVISVGRLHPLIFAVGASTPSVCVDLRDIFPTSEGIPKLRANAYDLSFSYFCSIEDFCVRFNGFVEATSLNEGYFDRLKFMRKGVASVFS